MNDAGATRAGDQIASDIGPGCGRRAPRTLPCHPDPLISALARYVEALHRRYPEGPVQLRREGLDARAKVSEMVTIEKDPAA